MLHKFGMGTREVADLAGVTPSHIHTELHRRGHWRGVRPGRRMNGRLLWPCEAVHRVAGGVPDREDMNHREIAFCCFLDNEDVQIDSSVWSAAQALFAKPDIGRDPAYAVEGLSLLVGIIAAFTERLDAQWSALPEGQRERAEKSLRYAGSMLDGFNQSK